MEGGADGRSLYQAAAEWTRTAVLFDSEELNKMKILYENTKQNSTSSMETRRLGALGEMQPLCGLNARVWFCGFYPRSVRALNCGALRLAVSVPVDRTFSDDFFQASVCGL